jgi:acetylornithine deacetylase/succinyl-diaminopimelate desuccinylase-like protein
VSHNEAEHAEPEHLVLGADALLQAVLHLDATSDATRSQAVRS